MYKKIIIALIILLCSEIIYASTEDTRISLLKEQAKDGNFYSMYRLGRILYEKGEKENGINYLNIACSKGEDQDACNYLKSINQTNTDDDPISILEEQAKKGNYHAMHWLGRTLYEHGLKAEGINYLNRACSDGSIHDACEYVKSINRAIEKQSPPKIPTNDELIEYYNSQIKKDDPFAMYRLGKILYDKGNEKEGIKLLNKACNVYNEPHACMFLDDINKKNIYTTNDGKNENNTNKATKGVEKNATYATVANLSKNKMDTTHNQSTIVKRDIFCKYTHVQKKSMGVSNLSAGYSSGVPWLDTLNTIVGVIDDAMELIHDHTYICSYSPIENGQDSSFKNDLDTKNIRYIVFFNGAFKNYYKLYSGHQVNELTIYPKTTVDYLGVIDKNNNILRLDAVRDGKIHPWTAADLPKLKNYKLEE